MLARTGSIPTGRGWVFEPKRDGFQVPGLHAWWLPCPFTGRLDIRHLDHLGATETVRAASATSRPDAGGVGTALSGQSRCEVTGSARKAEASVTLPAEPAAVGLARAFLKRTLDQAGIDESRRFEALLVASELVANAVTHGSRPGDEISLDVSLDATLLRIAVGDAARGTAPVALTRDEERPAGRGLAVVDRLAVWSERIVDGRREVRADLTL
jgi:anti-sigma regulatory factor (Ser/Thr protein kinase)